MKCMCANFNFIYDTPAHKLAHTRMKHMCLHFIIGMVGKEEFKEENRRKKNTNNTENNNKCKYVRWQWQQKAIYN